MTNSASSAQPMPDGRAARRVLQDLDLRVLERLRQVESGWVYPAALAGEMGAPNSHVQDAISRLSAAGFLLDSEPHRGIRLAGWPDRLVPDQIEWKLQTELIGRRIYVWNRTTSTNDLAWAHAHDRSFHGAVFLAEQQTSGRGRRGARWFSPPCSSVLCSVLLFPPDHIHATPWLTTLSVVASVMAVRQVTGLAARIKWPNDIRLGEKKTGGVLVESRRAGAAVLGIGLNVNISADAFPEELGQTATSLAIHLGRRLDRSELVRRLIQELDRGYRQVETQGTCPLWQRWQELADIVGRRAVARHGSGTLEGPVVETLADRPGLLIQPVGGEAVCVHPAQLTYVE